jgi:tRNA A-37 threonylcarbamoyl transferase component Bud32
LSSSDALVGEVLGGRYKVQEKESEELLGNVFRARDVVTEKLVQVKILHPHLASDDTRFGRFLREVQATSMVRHVNTIEMVDSGTHEGLHYLVMEYFRSTTLEEALENGPLPVERVAHIAAQVASAIGAAHQESVTHRGLSPRNILLLEDARTGDYVKVRDFGLSKLERFESEESTKLTQMGARVGNTSYMAPEYIDKNRFHPKGDLYALGCLMFEMLTGEKPYTGRAADILTAHVVSDVPHPRDKDESIPEWMDDIVVSMMAKRPEDRPGAYKLVAQLEDGVGHSLDPPSLGGAGGTASGDTDAKPGLPMAAIAGVVGVLMLLGGSMVVLAVVGVFLWFAWNEEPSTASIDLDGEPTIRVETEAPEPEPEAPPEEEEPAVEPADSPDPRPAAPARPVAKPPPPPVEPEPEPDDAGGTRIEVKANRRVLVFLNGNPKGFAPLTLKLPPGLHRVSAMLPGKPETEQEKEVRVRAGESPSVAFTF